MTTKVKELDNRRQGTEQQRAVCPLCNPRTGRVSADRLWSWSLDHPGEQPFKTNKPS